jgi:4'-phosphopantetheinyl transferase
MACKAATTWPGHSAPPLLLPGEVHVWAVWLDLAPAEQAALLPLLAEEERARTRRLVDATAGNRSAATRATLRVLLGAYAGTPPGSLAFARAPAGKPFLEDVPWLRFNVTHSEVLALVAVARDLEIGVDVERRRVVEDAAALAERYLAPDEARVIAAAPADCQSDAFLRSWTLREAMLKATGDGLSSGLSGPTETWSLRELAPDPGYVGALAVPSPECRLHCFTLQRS